MSDRGIGNRKMRKAAAKNKRRFLRLWHNVKRSAAYHSLSSYARAALIELLDRYTGINNGMIVLGVRTLADELRCTRDTAARALKELDDAGLIRPMTGGKWKGKRATEWRLMFERCHKTYEPAVTVWEPRQVSDRKDTEVRLEGHEPIKCPARGTDNRKNSISDPAKCPAGGTHIDIYQRVRGTDKQRIGTSNVVEFAESQKARRRWRPR